jgi:hypothetical protein
MVPEAAAGKLSERGSWVNCRLIIGGFFASGRRSFGKAPIRQQVTPETFKRHSDWFLCAIVAQYG